MLWDFLDFCTHFVCVVDHHLRCALIRECLPSDPEMDCWAGGSGLVHVEQPHLWVVSNCKNLFSGRAVSVCCVCRRKPNLRVVTRMDDRSGGTFLGLSVSTRSYIVVVGPVFLWWILHQSEARSRFARLVWLLTGFTIGIVPSLYLFVASPSVYLFNNLGYHALRSSSGLIGDWQAKMFVAAALFAGSDTGLQFSIVSAVCVAAVFLRRMRTATSLLPFLVAAVLGFISILPTPPFVEYFCLCMPFLIVAAVGSVNDGFAMLQSPVAKQIAGGICVALLAIFVLMGVLRFQRYVTTKQNPLENLTAVSNAIDQLADPGEKVVAFWPGYIFASKADPYPGLENQAGPPVASKLTVEDRNKYHLISPAGIEADLAAHRPRIVVIEDSLAGSPGPSASTLLQHNRLGTINRKLQQTVSDLVFNGNSLLPVLPGDGYTFQRRIGDIVIYTCCSRP